MTFIFQLIDRGCLQTCHPLMNRMLFQNPLDQSESGPEDDAVTGSHLLIA
jgi:hypothetical protein